MSQLIAITGCIAAGKTTVLNYLSQNLYKVWSADQEVNKTLENISFKKELKIIAPNIDLNTDIKEQIKEVLCRNDKVFAKIEKLIHNYIEQERKKFIQKNKSEKILFFEIPLLFENKLQALYQKSICVFASLKIRKTRVILINKMKIQQFEKLEKKQIKCSEKKKLTDYVIINEGKKEEIYKQIKLVIKKIKNAENNI